MAGLKQLIQQEIKQSGPMPVDRYMELCLSHPLHGYYMKRDPFGVNGDFTTAPEISQIFGEMVAIWLINKWQEIGSPADVAVVELGPGRGTLMADVLRTIKITPEFKPQVHLVEISLVLKALQQINLNSSPLEGEPELQSNSGGGSTSQHLCPPPKLRCSFDSPSRGELHSVGYGSIFWHTEIPTLGIPTIIIANEFFDALPVKQFVGGAERKITITNDNLAFNMPAESGLITETCPAALQIMQKITSECAGGIIIDYGYLQNSKISTLQAVAKHKYTNVLENPGDADITAHVDFASLVANSAKECLVTTQREFLLNHGASLRAEILGKEADLQRLIDPEQMGELFKVLCF